jgi:hypothetical protein
VAELDSVLLENSLPCTEQFRVTLAITIVAYFGMRYMSSGFSEFIYFQF